MAPTPPRPPETDAPAAARWRPAVGFPRTPTLSGTGVDRAAALRDQPDALAARVAAPEARALAFSDGKPAIALTELGPEPAWAPAADLPRSATGDPPVFLGVDDRGDALLAVDLAPAHDPTGLGGWPFPVKHIDLRSIASALRPAAAATIAEAKSLLSWHGTHPFCARCGAPTAAAQGGWRRDCAACGAKHFPRTDPVVIMLATRTGADGEERVILGRQHGWPGALHSLLAGYVEPGETIEDAARRETREEAGVSVGRAAYLATQPWPFPSTLMIGVWVEVLSDTLAPDLAELESCRWVTKAEARRALAGEHDAVDPPRIDAIARTLLEAWATDEIHLPDAPPPG